MRKFALLVGIVAALGLCGVPSAVAADPDVNHFTIADSFTDTDFCGTGNLVDVAELIRVTEFLAPNQPVDYRNVVGGEVIWTNPENGATVVRHFAGPSSDTIISGNPEGVSTHEITLIGQPTMLRTANGGVLLRQGGYLILHQVIDADGNVLSSEIIVERGLHPNAEADFTLVCALATEALGLS